MSVSNHIDALRRKHRDLDKIVAGLSLQPGARSEEVGRLKRKKLKIKDKINELGATSRN